MRSYTKVKKLGFPYIFITCCFFLFIITLSFFNLLSQGIFSDIVHRKRSVNMEIEPLNHGETGNVSVVNIPIQVLSLRPRVYYLPNFASKEQCEAIIGMAKPKLKPSLVALRKGETEETTQNVRTSTGVFMNAEFDESGILAAIEDRIAIATRMPRHYYEEFNILRYQIGQKYDSHYDAFKLEEYGPQNSQRVASFLLYLSRVGGGGETIFPFENGNNMNGKYDYRECIGLKVKPRQGDAIFFYNLFPNGTIDSRSLHGSCPVIKGEKWVATKWIRDPSLEES